MAQFDFVLFAVGGFAVFMSAFKNAKPRETTPLKDFTNE
jgi:hypothetical protein